MLGLCTAVLLLAGLYFAKSILAPVAFALFIIAVVWPLQRWLQGRMPKLLAAVVTIIAIVCTFVVMASLIVWGFGKIGQWFISNIPRFQELYVHATDWLEEHGILAAQVFSDQFNVGWILRAIQEVASILSSSISFWLVTFVFIVLGLLEVEDARRNIERLQNPVIRQSLLNAGADIAAKFQKYMLVRTMMSVLTGFIIWGFALLAGLELATAWGVIAFVLNYIPFIGPFVATVFPTLFALAQSESWQLALVVFLGLNLIQFIIGSYLEPRIAGATLSISPFVVLFAVFFWSFLWNLPGAFIGVPVVIAMLTVCAEHESSRWVATLMSGQQKMRA
jgi:AI-2 transport protein TqsA